MNVPPYVPEQIEIPANVAEEKHAVRVRFVRRVVLLHIVSVLVIAAVGYLWVTGLGLTGSALIALGWLLLLSLVRGVVKGRPVEQRISVALAPFMLASLGFVAREIYDAGFPIWTLLLGSACTFIYVLLCGRDLSFVGMFVLCGIGSSGIAAGLTLGMQLERTWTTWGLLLNVAYLAYFVYDLAALQTRRRLGEQYAAVVDLYRDSLNFITYSIRVWNHWRKYNVRSGYVGKRPESR